MVLLAPFPDVEAVALEAIGAVTDEVPVDVTPSVGTIYGGSGSVTPPNLQAMLPYQQVVCIGGSDDVITDSSLLIINTFAATIVDAYGYADSARQQLISGPNTTSAGVIDQAQTVTRPHEVPYGAGIRKVTATYRVYGRRSS